MSVTLKIKIVHAGSYTLPRSDVTVHAETNLIWPSVTSPSPSPILPMYLSVPRSVSVHVAFNVLGHTMGFMELGARGEGLEFLMEDVVSRYFGKKAARKNPAEVHVASEICIFFKKLHLNWS